MKATYTPMRQARKGPVVPWALPPPRPT